LVIWSTIFAVALMALTVAASMAGVYDGGVSRMRDRPDDQTIARVIAASPSLAAAGEALGYRTTWARRQAERLGVRSQYRLVEEVLPDDASLKAALSAGRGLAALSRDLGVSREALARKADALGICGRKPVRAGLPDEETLIRDICSASSMAALARHYGVADHTVRNQSKRLGVRPGDPVPPPRPAKEDPEAVARRAAENLALFEAASDELAQVERQRDELAARELVLRAEIERLRAPAPAVEVVPTDIDGILAEAQATGSLVILPKAVKSARKATYVDLGKLRTILLLLRDAWVPMMRMDPGTTHEDVQARFGREGLDVGRPMRNLAKLKHLGYTATWKGKEILLDRRVKHGVDPARLIRVYFHYDEDTQVAVVGWLPTHLAITNYA
jgi:hypothetical protein